MSLVFWGNQETQGMGALGNMGASRLPLRLGSFSDDKLREFFG